MIDLPKIFSVIYILTAGFGLMIGMYILRIKRGAWENRTFFICTISLVFWALGLGLALSSETEEASLMWRRVAAVGWGIFFSLLLQFLIALTGRNALLKKWWTYVLLYLPAVLSVLVFAIPTALNPAPFTMVRTAMGWTNVAENNGWDIFYMVYYLTYTAVGLALVWYWGARSGDRNIKKQSIIIVVSFLGALVLGTLTDMMANTLLGVTIPQMGPVFILIPIFAIYMMMKRYGLLHHISISTNEEILNPIARRKIYRYLSIALFAGALLIFLTQYVMYDNGDLLKTLIFSAAFIVIGLVIQMVNKLKIVNRAKDLINIICVSLVIPAATLYFIDFASVTVWAFPFILIIVSLVFNKRLVLRTVAFFTLITQVVVWILAPEVAVSIDHIDFSARIGIFAIGIGLAMYVNKVYIFRLKENADQIKLQALLSDLSAEFVTVNLDNIGDKINEMLSKAGELVGADRAYVWFFSKRGNGLSCSYVWQADGETNPADWPQSFSGVEFPGWVEQVMKRKTVNITNVSQLPEHVYARNTFLTNVKYSSLLCVPVISSEKVIGFLSFTSVKAVNNWRDDHISILKILANTMANAMVKTETEKEINFMAYYDHLTGLPNRLLFKDKLTRAILQSAQTGRYLGVIFLDLDSFKAINDTLGHKRGDELLRIIAGRLKNCIRESDLVSRFGGDEFLLMISDMEQENDIIGITETIMAQFSLPFELKGQEFFITASAGIAMCPEDGADTEKLIKNADIAMYSAKEMGKNQYALCSQEMKDIVTENAILTAQLYKALGRGELLLYYQPQICLQTKKIIGVEALLRWQNPEFGMINPSRFIPLAEQTGLINSIGEWVLWEACNQNKKWQEMGLPPVRMGVNISVIQLRNPKLHDIVKEALKVTGLNPGYLELEITESAATKESDYIIELLNGLKSLGLMLSIDDFGTEYSSLSRLKTLPVDRIKMDMQFVRGIEGSTKDQAITKVIINLAKNLGLKVIAEGVETENQLDFLNRKMCDEVQGFYFYKPMPPEQVEAVLRNLITFEMSETIQK